MELVPYNIFDLQCYNMELWCVLSFGNLRSKRIIIVKEL